MQCLLHKTFDDFSDLKQPFGYSKTLTGQFNSLLGSSRMLTNLRSIVKISFNISKLLALTNCAYKSPLWRRILRNSTRASKLFKLYWGPQRTSFVADFKNCKTNFRDHYIFNTFDTENLLPQLSSDSTSTKA